MSAAAKVDDNTIAAKQAAYLHQSMTKALKFGDMLRQFPEMVETCIGQETWKMMYCRDKGRCFESAREYFLHNEPDGVGLTELRGFELLREHKKTLGIWREAMKHQGERTDLHYNVMEVGDATKKQQGNSRAYTLVRLADESPGLYEAVCRGEMSANRAAIEAGFRKPPKPFDQIKKLLTKLTDAERRQLKDLL